MTSFRTCARARVAGSLVALAALAAFAEESAPPLSLPEAERLALAHQPQLLALGAAVEAATHDADAAGSLPDPMLTTGVTDLPTQGDARFSGRRDDFTMYTVGVEQDLPLASKRRLREKKAQLTAERARLQLDLATRAVRRDATLAWLDRWQAERELALVEAEEREARAAQQSADIAYRTGRAPQSDLLAAGVAAEMLGDEIEELRAQGEKARPMLARWIGETDAQRAIAAALPDAQPPPIERALAAIPQHPELASVLLDQGAADTDAAMARAEYRPDVSVGVEYGYRPDFADYVSVNFKVGLPVFTKHRQDARVAAATAQATAATESSEDVRRRLAADIRSAYTDWTSLRTRLARYDGIIVPQSDASAVAAQRAYAAGSGTLTALLNARQATLTAQRTRARLAADLARAAVRLAYYLPEPQS